MLVYNLNTIVERYVTYVLWTVPVIYVFWPSYRTWYGAQKTLKRRGSSFADGQEYRPLNYSAENNMQQQKIQKKPTLN